VSSLAQKREMKLKAMVVEFQRKEKEGKKIRCILFLL